MDGETPMAKNVAQKLISSHLVEGEMTPGQEIGLRIDQTLTQDATGTLVMLELEAMELDRAKTEVSVQYVDHNMIQVDNKNPDDHLFLESACERFGLWFSRPGNGVSHPVHQETFGKPGKTLLGSDSHTCSAGAIGMLAIGTGGFDVALAIAGQPYYVRMPEIWGVKLTGKLPDWVTPKDVILEMLRRHDVKGGVGRIIEYYGPGLEELSAMDRHTIANMGQELGATSTVFPSDGEVRRFLRSQQREEDWEELLADEGCGYDVHEEINLSELEPLIAMPSSPGNVVPVREVAGEKIYQAYVGSSADPSLESLALAAEMVDGRKVATNVSFDINPASRQILQNLVREGYLSKLIAAGARLHQAGCNGCIGMGQAPATGTLSLRTVPRNFPGRSGTREDKVCLVGPAVATASALKGVITDPRDLDMDFPHIEPIEKPVLTHELLAPPPPPEESKKVDLRKSENISTLPEFEELPDSLEVPVLLKMGDNISTDEILRAGAQVLPFRSNIPEISKFSFDVVDETYYDRAVEVREQGGHCVVGGSNYGQGSSREHAALAPRYLGLRLVLAKSYSRIHWQNLVSFGALPVTFANEEDHARIDQGDVLSIQGLHSLNAEKRTLQLENKTKGETIDVEHSLSKRQVEILKRGGLINWMRGRLHGGVGAAR